MTQEYEYKHITPEEAQFFMENGYLIVKEAFTREQAAEFTKDIWVRLGIDPLNPSTWDKESVHMPTHKRVPIASFAPRAWGAMQDLLGGEDRIDAVSSAWGDAFIVNLGVPPPADPAAPAQTSMYGTPAPTPASLTNWHVDGDFFTHFLDSPEQALLVIPVFSDITSGGGATYIAPDGIAPFAKYLAQHPQGVVPVDFAFVPADALSLVPGTTIAHEDVPGYRSQPAEAAKCAKFVELTASVGDVVLMHPLMPHSASPNAHRRVPRVITNPRAAVREPFCFARDDPGEYSLVERTTLRALGVERFEFVSAGPRTGLVPARVGREAAMVEVEKRWLAAVRERAREGVPAPGATPRLQIAGQG